MSRDSYYSDNDGQDNGNVMDGGDQTTGNNLCKTSNNPTEERCFTDLMDGCECAMDAVFEGGQNKAGRYSCFELRSQ